MLAGPTSPARTSAHGRAPVRQVAAPGTYSDPLPLSEEIRALREGLVVVQFDPRVHERDLRLRAIYDTDPTATILAAKPPKRRFAVAATAWRRLLGCPGFAADVIDALRVSRDRYAGVR